MKASPTLNVILSSGEAAVSCALEQVSSLKAAVADHEEWLDFVELRRILPALSGRKIWFSNRVFSREFHREDPPSTVRLQSMEDTNEAEELLSGSLVASHTSVPSSLVTPCIPAAEFQLQQPTPTVSGCLTALHTDADALLSSPLVVPSGSTNGLSSPVSTCIPPCRSLQLVPHSSAQRPNVPYFEALFISTSPPLLMVRRSPTTVFTFAQARLSHHSVVFFSFYSQMQESSGVAMLALIVAALLAVLWRTASRRRPGHGIITAAEAPEIEELDSISEPYDDDCSFAVAAEDSSSSSDTVVEEAPTEVAIPTKHHVPYSPAPRRSPRLAAAAAAAAAAAGCVDLALQPGAATKPVAALRRSTRVVRRPERLTYVHGGAIAGRPKRW